MLGGGEAAGFVGCVSKSEVAQLSLPGESESDPGEPAERSSGTVVGVSISVLWHTHTQEISVA